MDQIVRKTRVIGHERRGVTPPTNFGILDMSNSRLPGSPRSGERPRKKSSPTRSPIASSRGRTISSVVPGYVVLSRQMSWPRRSTRCRSRRHSSRCIVDSVRGDASAAWERGRGVHPTPRDAPDRRLSTAKRSHPGRVQVSYVARPGIQWSTFTGSMSRPTTRKPTSPSRTESGSPT